MKALTEEEPSLGADKGKGYGLVLPPKKRKPRAHTWGRGGSGVYTAIVAEQFGRVKNYPYTLSILKEFEESLSSERMATYLKAARGDRQMAARLYTWNTAVSLRMLRNRIAHHEPIFGQRLRANHQRILQVTGWISPVTRVWIEHHSRIPTLLKVPSNESDVRF